MTYDKSVIDRALREKEAQKIKKEAELQARRREIYEKLPRAAEIEAELKTSALDAIRASFKSGDGAAPAIAALKDKNLKLQKERAELLVAAGYSVDATEPVYSCDMCEDTGRCCGDICPCVLELCKKISAEIINESLNLPDASFEEFDLSLYPERGEKISPRAQMSEVLTFCKSYAAEFPDGAESLLFRGESGTGKTHLAAAMARDVAESGASVVFDSAYNILGVYEDVKFGRSEFDTSVFETCDLLVIDDLGCEMTTPFSVAAFFNLISEREKKKLPTAVITTLEKKEIKKRYGAQAASRLFGSFVNLEFMGGDLRGKV